MKEGKTPVKSILFFILLLCISSYGWSPTQLEQAKTVLQTNPSLLNAQNKSDLLQQYGSQNIPLPTNQTNPYIRSEMIPQNDILQDTNQTQSSDLTQNIMKENQEENNSIKRLMPLEYKPNDKKLWEIKSEQSKFEEKPLKRFSSLFFKNKNPINPNRIVVPSNYIISRGDIITFWIYGATNRQESLEVDSRGNINIPQVGPVHVAGEKFQEVKELLTNYLASSYKNSQVVVDLNSFATAQVTVTGFVNAPGIYNTTTVSSIKDILMQAGGVSDAGSVRNIEVNRNSHIVARVDFYHLLAQGRDHGDVVLQPGDIVHIPKAHGLVTIDGEVTTPAIYEIKSHDTLNYILKIAGGLKAAANGKDIFVKRYNNHTNIDYQKISLKAARHFRLKDGDQIVIGKLHKANENFIDVEGNVIDPGKKHIGAHQIKLSIFLQQQLLNGKLESFFLENTQFSYAMIKRLDKTLNPEIYHVNLLNVINGSDDFMLQNRDVLYIFNKLDTELNPYVTIQEAKSEEQLRALQQFQELNSTLAFQKSFKELYDLNTSDFNAMNKNKLDILNDFSDINYTKYSQVTQKSKLLLQEGKFQFTKGMTLHDLINAAGKARPFDESKVKIIRQDPLTNKTTVKIVNYTLYPNFILKPFDKVYLFDIDETKPVANASIFGEVVKEGQYPVEERMTLEEFIESAGGLTPEAYPKNCEVIRYHLVNGERQKKIFNVSLAKAKEFLIQPYDEVTIKKIPYWNQKQTITLGGEVKFPGTYVIHSGEKLSSVIERAGGFTNEAFLYGAVFSRKEIAELQKKSLQRSLSKLKEQIILASIQSAGSKTMGQISVSEGIKAVQSLIYEAEKVKPIGRISIHLTKDLKKFTNSPNDLSLKDGDKLFVPSFNDTVVVSGEVMNPMALTYNGNNIRAYIDRTGGLTDVADTDHIFVLHANGEAQKASIGSYLFSSHSVNIKRGDVIIIPKKIMIERGIDLVGNIADIFYKLTLTLASMHTIGAI